MRCEECETETTGTAKGWRAYIAEDQPPFVVIYCPTCALREFGQRFASRFGKPS